MNMRDVYCMSRLCAQAAFSTKDKANVGINHHEVELRYQEDKQYYLQREHSECVYAI